MLENKEKVTFKLIRVVKFSFCLKRNEGSGSLFFSNTFFDCVCSF